MHTSYKAYSIALFRTLLTLFLLEAQPCIASNSDISEDESASYSTASHDYQTEQDDLDDGSYTTITLDDSNAQTDKSQQPEDASFRRNQSVLIDERKKDNPGLNVSQEKESINPWAAAIARASGHAATSSMPTPPRNKRRVSLQKSAIPTDTFLFGTPENDLYYDSALVQYTSTSERKNQANNWDNPREVMRNIDLRLFTDKRNSKALSVGIIGALIGLVPSTPLTASLTTAFGDALNFRPDTIYSNSLIAWSLSTMTPIFSYQLGKMSWSITAYFTEKVEYPERSTATESGPCSFKKTKLYKSAIGGLSLLTLVDATVNLGLVALIYSNQFKFTFYITGGPYFASFAERYFKNGLRCIDRLFCSNQDTNLNYQKRKLLIDGLKRFQEAVARDNKFTKKIYQLIDEEIATFNTNNSEEEHFSILSALILKVGRTWKVDPESQDPDTPLLQYENFQIQQDTPRALNRISLNTLSTFLSGLGAIGRAVTTEYLLEHLLISVLGVPAPTASIIAWGCAVPDAAIRAILEYDIQRRATQNVLNIFKLNHLVDFPWLKKAVGGSTSLINGTLIALSKAFAGITALQKFNVPPSITALLLIPAAILDFNSFRDFFDQGMDNLISETATIRRPALDANIHRIKAQLRLWCQKIEECLSSKWDHETISKLFREVFRSK